MLDVKEFLDKKEKGIARVYAKTEQNIVVAYKSYDLEKAKIGELVELPEQVVYQSISELTTKKADVLAQAQNVANDIDAFLALEVE